ncbi:MAG: signal peptidase II [Deltaproteobacteria bacterium]|nr:signal peptidase II [Candidatus Anaeroferrophillus wilburensis]MBN2888679.1 signal peptidase II [Deltaproteobacteria bacterium]
MKRLIPLVWIAGLVIMLDQASKILALTYLSPVYPLKVIDGCFSLTLVLNSGVAFGLFSQVAAAWKSAALLLLSGVTVLLLIWYYWREKEMHWLITTAFSLVVGGAVGNMIDRARLGKVVDFLDFYWHHHHWPAFNVADSAITIGVLLMLVATFRQNSSDNASSID